jgi:hypothetical protein
MGGIALLIAAGCLPLLTACTGHGASAVNEGAVSGSLLRVGGPSPGAPVALTGQVVAPGGLRSPDRGPRPRCGSPEAARAWNPA